MALIEQTLQTNDPERKLQIRLFNKHQSTKVVVIAGAMGVPREVRALAEHTGNDGHYV